jgi:uncharacterized protein Yka (UPF0111/DUF47 family)
MPLIRVKETAESACGNALTAINELVSMISSHEELQQFVQELEKVEDDIRSIQQRLTEHADSLPEPSA